MAEMGSAAAEISLELELFTSRSVADFLNEASATARGDGRLAKLEESVRNLAEEKKKIEAFKRELPLCMRLVSDVIEGLEKELENRRGERYLRVLGESIPAKSNVEEKGTAKLGEDCMRKTNWISSAQLWSDNSGRISGSDDKIDKIVTMQSEMDRKPFRSQRSGERSTPMTENLFLEPKILTCRGAFMPFKRLSAIAANSKGEEKPAIGFPDLPMQAPAMCNGALTLSATEGHCSSDPACKGGGRAEASTPAKVGDLSSSEASRKVRRCWSPELHRRFLFAIQQLGGAHVATPKQIRELMKVDGLTNDEVKSHLQKYRLHAKKVPNSPDSANQNVEILASELIAEEQHSNSSQQSFPQAGSPQSPLLLCQSIQGMPIVAGGCSEEENEKSDREIIDVHFSKLMRFSES